MPRPESAVYLCLSCTVSRCSLVLAAQHTGAHADGRCPTACRLPGNEHLPHFMPCGFRPCCLGAVSPQEVQHLGLLEGRRLWPPVGVLSLPLLLACPISAPPPLFHGHVVGGAPAPGCSPESGWQGGRAPGRLLQSHSLDSAVPVACAEKAFLCAQLASRGTVAEPCKVTGVNGQPRVPV